MVSLEPNIKGNSPTALITGASRGIGRACARLFAANGWQLRLIARNEHLLNSVAESLPNKGHHYLSADLMTASGRKALFSWIDNDLPEAIIQCLGGQPSESVAIDPWQAAMQLNFHAVVTINEYLIPRFLNRGCGTIIHVSSSAAVHGQAFTPYACAKAALNRYITNRGRECLSSDVIVCGIMPAAVEGDDNAWAHAKKADPARYEQLCRSQLLGRAQTTDEVASAFLMLCGPMGRLFGGCVLPADATI